MRDIETGTGERRGRVRVRGERMRHRKERRGTRIRKNTGTRGMGREGRGRVGRAEELKVHESQFTVHDS